ncbi:HopJ type III effector protein [Algoriphagus sp. D3-2-R+10]|uniref:HopJ type III effector protein n=1 Tax=Algoriphagus aurantiacus TaxID=3103948 RepID=UPI002B39935A|nr:HopJ type III effector protein [Algoriphagus sp. D3-2-R+10]MEB2776806.1 HopJ type III effector protein [Algoriphagus sp. D3-2-R+10]
MNLLDQIKNAPATISFSEVIAHIDAHFEFTPTRFLNGTIVNEAGQNNGSCKIFSFAKLHNLTPIETLALFGDFYRKDVLENPDGTDHQNIRNFIHSGWEGIKFDGEVLNLR